jgi:hypothetical protein
MHVKLTNSRQAYLDSWLLNSVEEETERMYFGNGFHDLTSVKVASVRPPSSHGAVPSPSDFYDPTDTQQDELPPNKYICFDLFLRSINLQ